MAETKLSSHGQTVNARTESALIVEQFLNDNYRFRRNQLNGKVEFDIISPAADGDATEEEPKLHFRPLTEQALNSIILRAMREEICEKGSPKSDITLYLASEDVPLFNPIQDYLEHLPQWDGKNHVAALFGRIPGISSEQHAFLAVWLRSCVAHWLQMDTLHGNEVVPTLIGAQGCGKTTFLRRLLPKELREYYLDHLNLSNKFDKEMALTNNLLVNLDELDAISARQHPQLKQALSKNKVNGRPIFGAVQEDRLRFASFTATTNNPHPLTDVTGSRRYLCLSIPKGQMIDNRDDIDYGQLYAQVVYELQELKSPYWYSNEEVARIQQLNLNYMAQKDISEMIDVCFRKPEEGEKVKALSTTQMLDIIREEYPSVDGTLKTKMQLGRALKAMNYEIKSYSNVSHYLAVPLKAA
jgi:GTPase SAR1 family protein